MNHEFTQAAVSIENALKKGGQQSAGSVERAASAISHQFHGTLQLPHQTHACFPVLLGFAMAGLVPELFILWFDGMLQLLKSQLFQTLASFIQVTPVFENCR